jgi:TolB-like protein
VQLGATNVQFIFGDHTLDGDRRELLLVDAIASAREAPGSSFVASRGEPNRVVSKDDLIASIWHGRVVSDSTLTSRINAARKALGDSGGKQKLIRTIARKGIRFVGEVHTRPMGLEPHAEIHELSRAALPLPDRPAIAVLPFINMSGDPEHEYFSDGISEDIITALSKLRWFFVIARNSSFTYKGKAVHMKQVAEELGVGYVVEGSVRKSGDRVRITAQLNDVATGSHIWAERYDRDITDVFAVQDEITEAIVAAIEPQLYAAENFRAQRKPPDSMDAWDLVMRALSHYWRVTRQDNVVAQALLTKRPPSTPTTVRHSACLPPARLSARTWAGRTWRRWYGSPSGQRWRRSGPTAKIPGRTTHWAMSVYSRGVLMTRSPNSKSRCS